MPASDPIRRFLRWYAAAARAGVVLPDAMALATADGRGRPAVRYVLLKEASARGFVFFTDGRSQKGRELAVRHRAALAFYWDATGKQVRVEGRVVPLATAEVDAYWDTRPRGSQLAAVTSEQSHPMPSRPWLVARWRRRRDQLRGQPVRRPAAWGGFRVIPDTIEFWTRGANRLHTRERFERARRGWRRVMLQP